jgi:hypothetical protein
MCVEMARASISLTWVSLFEFICWLHIGVSGPLFARGLKEHFVPTCASSEYVVTVAFSIHCLLLTNRTNAPTCV